MVPEIKRLKRKYKLKSIKEFKQYPDLAAVYEKCRNLESQGQPNYSTFNPQVAKLEQEFEKKAKTIDKNDKKAKIDLVVEYIKKFDENCLKRDSKFKKTCIDLAEGRTTEGDAHERNGSFDFIISNFCGFVIYRQSL